MYRRHNLAVCNVNVKNSLCVGVLFCGDVKASVTIKLLMLYYLLVYFTYKAAKCYSACVNPFSREIAALTALQV